MWLLYVHFTRSVIDMPCSDAINPIYDLQRYLTCGPNSVTEHINDILRGVDVLYIFFTCTLDP